MQIRPSLRSPGPVHTILLGALLVLIVGPKCRAADSHIGERMQAWWPAVTRAVVDRQMTNRIDAAQCRQELQGLPPALRQTQIISSLTDILNGSESNVLEPIELFRHLNQGPLSEARWSLAEHLAAYVVVWTLLSPYDHYLRLETPVMTDAGGQALALGRIWQTTPTGTLEPSVDLRGPWCSDDLSIRLALTATATREPADIYVALRAYIAATYQINAACMDDRPLGLLHIPAFTPDTPEQCRDALADFRSRDIDRIYIDLRGNHGGDLLAARLTADLFLAADRPLFVHEVDGRQRQVRSLGPVAWNQRVDILVDHETASAAEIFAWVLNREPQITVIGGPTYGKRTTQRRYPLPDGGSLWLTNGQVLIPDADKNASGAALATIPTEDAAWLSSQQRPLVDDTDQE